MFSLVAFENKVVAAVQLPPAKIASRRELTTPLANSKYDNDYTMIIKFRLVQIKIKRETATKILGVIVDEIFHEKPC